MASIGTTGGSSPSVIAITESDHKPIKLLAR